MKRYSVAVLLGLIIFSGSAGAQYYWFQTGASASAATYNNGAGVSIRTVTQNPQSGSFGFWVGELLQDGAFVQMGYLVENASGYYPSYCSPMNCTDTEKLNAGDAEWFYEYFPNSATNTFLGAVGPDGSAGQDGALNTYQFYSKGDEWYFLLNGNVVGSVLLGSGSSGGNGPVAFAELSDSAYPNSVMHPVNFYNLTDYVNGAFRPVEYGYAYIGYGVSSATGYQNPYGIEEQANTVNNFVVGSGLPRPSNNTLLWSLGYDLSINSAYAIENSTVQYSAYSITGISVPKVYYIGNGTRAVFKGWKGSGIGSYTGTQNGTDIALDGNISETAIWQLEYYFNVSSAYGNAIGSGWYAANSIAAYGLEQDIVNVSDGSRMAFTGWSGLPKGANGTVTIDAPKSIAAQWQRQFYVNATADYGNVSGGGWYANGSMANLTVLDPVENLSGSHRLAFYSWSDGAGNSTVSERITAPTTMHADFRNKYLVSFDGENEYGDRIGPVLFSLDGRQVGSNTFLYAGQNYTITGAYYNGVDMTLNTTLMVNGTASETVKLPVYNVEIMTYDVFGIPVNASATLEMPNGSSVSDYSGSSGYIVVPDVPYGELNGKLDYLGSVENVDTQAGKVAKVVFVSQTDLEAFAAAIILAAAFYIASARRHARLGRVKR